MTESERAAALEAIAAEIALCTRCPLSGSRDRSVPGEGSVTAEVVVVGEGPGRDENRAGRPFVGASGKLLTELFGSLGWRREEVFITNVVKCWPPGNRDPQPDEIAACAPFLRRQLEVIDPAVIMTAGKHSLNVFMPGARIGQVHGTAAPAPAESGASDAVVFAMYHPAFALYDGSNRPVLQRDIAQLPALVDKAKRRRARLRSGEAGPSAAPAQDGSSTPAAAPLPEPGAAATDQLTLF